MNPTIELNTKYGEMLVRPGTLDEYVIREQPGYRYLGLLSDDVVLDVGGNIGAFARWALQQGVQHVVSYEPEPANFELLQHNVAGYAASTCCAAVVADGSDPYVDLYVNSGKNAGLHSTTPTRGRERVRVPAASWSTVLGTHRFTAVKCDIEGGEYGLDWRALPATVTKLAMELHLTRKHWREIDAPAVVETLATEGWTPTRRPHIGAQNWTTVGVWHR